MKYSIKHITILLTITLSGIQAKELPVWEVNVGVGGIQMPHYRGSNNYTRFVLPFPSVKYRSKYFNVDRGKVQGLLYKSKIFELDISVAGSLPASSDKNSARVDMPTLNTTFEVGPALIANLWKSKDKNSKIWFELPIRAAVSLDIENISIKDHGFLSSPSIKYQLNNNDSWNWEFSLGSIYANNRYHNYFYGVPVRYQTKTRPSYNANGGYSGSHATIETKKKIDNKWLAIAYVRYDNISKATFIDSPLIERSSNVSMGFVIMRRVAKSKKNYKD